jgi:phosphoserine phosphatase
VFARAVWAGDAERAFRLGRMGAGCIRLFLRAWAHRDRTLECIARITDLINRDAIAGLPVAFVERFTRDYARRAVRRIDRRLLDPLQAARRRHGVRLGVISSGSRAGIRQALAAAGCELDFVLANDFRLDGDTVEALELSIMSNKAEVLAALLDEQGVGAEEVMYVGDSQPDEACFAQVGWPVVSFLARRKDRRRFARRHGAFVPRRVEDLRRHLRQACS